MTNRNETHLMPEFCSGYPIKAIIPRTMEEAYRLAKAVVDAKMAPRGLETPDSCMIAILHGLEVGLAPMASLQRIAILDGRPTIWGDGAMALVRASGRCAQVKERIEGVGDLMEAVCEAKRKGESKPVIGRFSITDARIAGLWGKAGPWTLYPKRMLQMRARAFALRDAFADVLGGLYLREELEASPASASIPEPPAPPEEDQAVPRHIEVLHAGSYLQA